MPIGGLITLRLNILKVKELAARRGWSQAAFAERAGVSRQALCAILARGSASAQSAVKLADALGVELSEIAEGRA